MVSIISLAFVAFLIMSILGSILLEREYILPGLVITTLGITFSIICFGILVSHYLGFILL